MALRQLCQRTPPTPRGRHAYCGRNEMIGRSALLSCLASSDTRNIYVANQGSGRKPADTVSVVDPQAGKVVATIKTDKGAHGVAISKDGRYVFVTNIEAGTLSVIDTASNKVVATHRVGAGPNGVTYLE